MKKRTYKKTITRAVKKPNKPQVETAVQWFPGHMAKTRRLIKENLKLIDVVVEIIDARIPISSRNPELDSLTDTKPRIVMLNKSDYADNIQTKKWLAFFESKNIPALACDCKSGNGVKAFVPIVKKTLAELIKSREDKGMAGRALRVMVVGIPNVGKSSFINRMAGKNKVKVEDRPGVTRDRQWVTLNGEIDIMDMPGVLWPKFEDKTVGEHLAFTGAVKDNVYDTEHLSARLLSFLKDNYYENIKSRYDIDDFEDKQGYEILEMIAKKRGMVLRGNELDTQRASIAVLDEFRAGLIGKITIEKI